MNLFVEWLQHVGMVLQKQSHGFSVHNEFIFDRHFSAFAMEFVWISAFLEGLVASEDKFLTMLESAMLSSNLEIIQRMVSDLESPAKCSIVHDFVMTWSDLEKIGHHTFSYEFCVVPEEHLIVFTRAPVNTKTKQEMTLFIVGTFNVPAMHGAIQVGLSSYATRHTTGIVMDSCDVVSHTIYRLRSVGKPCLSVWKRAELKWKAQWPTPSRLHVEVPRDTRLLRSRMRVFRQGESQVIRQRRGDHRVPKDPREHHQRVDCVATIRDEFKVVDPPVRRFSGEELEDLSCRPSVVSRICGPRRKIRHTLVAKSKLPLHNELRSILKSPLLAPRSEPANFVLWHSGFERRGDVERHSPLSALALPHSG